MMLKSFFPGRIPFPLLHVDTNYKFPEMIEFRDSYARKSERSSSFTGTKRLSDAVQTHFPLAHRSVADCLKQISSRRVGGGGFNAAFGGHAAMKKNRGQRREFTPSVIRMDNGTRKTSAQNSGTF